MNSGSLATNTVSFTTRRMPSIPPTTLAAAATALSAAVRASSAACSALTSAPTLPRASIRPSTNGNWPEVKTWPAESTAGM